MTTYQFGDVQGQTAVNLPKGRDWGGHQLLISFAYGEGIGRLVIAIELEKMRIGDYHRQIMVGNN